MYDTRIRLLRCLVLFGTKLGNDAAAVCTMLPMAMARMQGGSVPWLM